MKNKPWMLALAVLVVALVGFGLLWRGGEDHAPQETAAAHGDDDGHDHGEEEGHDDEATEISDDVAQSMGITTAPAGAGAIRETVRLSGRIVLNQNRAAEVKARFPGVVRGVFKQVGDPVTRGEKLATVESNESLQVYAVPSPLDGVVLERSISVGDTAAERPIFVVADLSQLWAEFFVFAGDMEQIRQGQKILVRSLDGTRTSEGTLLAIQPTAEASSQTVLARAELDNSNGAWRAGMTVQGDVVVVETPVSIAVPAAAVQTLEGRQVVFVKQGTRYLAVPVTTGRADADSIEITDGITAGQDVVGEGSFVVKADIGKAGAEHAH